MNQPKNLQSITRKTLLYKSGVEYADYGLNHIEGCSHGCTYPCYAMMMKKRCGQVKTYEDWIHPKIVENTLELLSTELPRLKDKINEVFLCFATDPFMYGVNEVNDLSLQIVQTLNDWNIKTVTVSKGVYPSALASKTKYGTQNEYGSTLVSLDEDFRRIYEPHASPISERVKALRKLHDSGLKTWVSMEPYPTPNIMKQDIREILSEISFVDRIVFGKWNYNRKTSDFSYYKNFYNSMSYQVLNFCAKNSIEVHIKEGTISPGCLKNSDEETFISGYLLTNRVGG